MTAASGSCPGAAGPVVAGVVPVRGHLRPGRGWLAGLSPEQDAGGGVLFPGGRLPLEGYRVDHRAHSGVP